MKSKVSIIVPAYNAEKFLKKCIDSILNQTLSTDKIELILCNDGSSDNTLKIIKNYAIFHPGVVVIDSHRNIGAARTRNRALDLATGDYIMFVDADDWIDPDYIEQYLNVAIKTGADVVYGGYRRVLLDGTIKDVVVPSKFSYGRYIVVGVCSKLHKREFLSKHNIYFSDKKFGEDVAFCIKEITATSQWIQINNAGYNYLYNTNSITNSDQKSFTKKNEDTALSLLEEILNVGTPLYQNRNFRFFILRTITYHLLYSSSTMTVTQFVDFHEKLYGIVRQRNVNFSLIRDSLPPPGEKIQVSSAIISLMIIERLHLLRFFAAFLCKDKETL